jgi:hypothetical protein
MSRSERAKDPPLANQKVMLSASGEGNPNEREEEEVPDQERGRQPRAC